VEVEVVDVHQQVAVEQVQHSRVGLQQQLTLQLVVAVAVV
jgi:hypothetical protein